MNLTDLRDELHARADSADASADLLPGVRRKITRTKRRRTAVVSGVVGCVALIAAITTGILPGLGKTSDPDPAKDVPSDYFENGVTLPGVIGSDRLLKGAVGLIGQNPLELRWTPTTTHIALRTYCRVYHHPTTVSIDIELNGRPLVNQPCHDAEATLDPVNRWEVPSDAPEWLAVPQGQPARLSVTARDSEDKIIKNAKVQTAIGIYSMPTDTTMDGLPRREPATSADDYAKAGYRYRAKVADNRLLGATIGELGETTLKFNVTGTGGPLLFQDLCMASPQGSYQLSFAIPGIPKHSSTCWTRTTDLGNGDQQSLPAGQTIPAGQTVEVTVTLEDDKGRLVSEPGARIGLGIYQAGSERTTDGIALPETIEKGGFDYVLTDLRTVDATLRTVDLPTPSGKPFIIRYGSSALGATDEVMADITGIDAPQVYSESPNGLGGSITLGRPARGPGTATFKVLSGTPTKGKLFIAIYTPAGDNRPEPSPTR